MDDPSDVAARPAGSELDRGETRRAIVREMRLVEQAIALVASGGAPRVTVGGLTFGAQILPQVASLAQRQQVQVHELWSPWSDICQVEVRAGA
ncbi:MAG TPA: hypothetical protein VEI48_11430 [Candidatus Sulfotelmatobacter sp.]|nr:hypothetical protein [Candidatus Sulfotelmatobacter sp.]